MGWARYRDLYLINHLIELLDRSKAELLRLEHGSISRIYNKAVLKFAMDRMALRKWEQQRHNE